MKFGVFIDSYMIKRWQFNAIKKILEETSFTLELVIINDTNSKSSFPFKNLFFYLYKFFLVKSKESEKIDIRSLLSTNIKIKPCKILKKGKFSEYFVKEDIEEIKNYNLDFTLRFGFGIIRGEILKTFKYGVWSFHHGDETKYRGGPYCFWEIYKNDKENGAILQVLTNKLDGGIILKKGIFKTISNSYSRNIDQALKISSEWPSLICKKIENQTFVKNTKPTSTNAPIYLLPKNYQVVIFLLKIILNKLRSFYYNFLTYDHWHVGIINKDITEVLRKGINKNDIKWIQRESNNFFIADPFIFNYKNDTLLALECLNYKDFVGKIKVYKGKNFNIEIPNFFKNVKYHLSYSNFFEFDNRFFCLPETFEANNLILFEKVNDKWKEHVLIKNVKPIDPDIIFHDDFYYLFTSFKGEYHETNLHVYYSKSIDSGWQKHKLNPVISDVRSARGAGKIFKSGNNLYRPGQNYSKHKEGQISISKIKKLSPLEYEEEIVKEILPIKGVKYSDKIHTINSVNNLTVIDACKIKPFIFRPDIFLSLIRSKI
jgi:hypothetical protein